jgi:hypothetical protein
VYASKKKQYACPWRKTGGLNHLEIDVELEYLFFLSRIFFPEFNIRLYVKNSESDYFFSSTKIRIFFSATLGIRIYFLEKKYNPSLQVKLSEKKILNETKNHTPAPFKLNGRSLSYTLNCLWNAILYWRHSVGTPNWNTKYWIPVTNNQFYENLLPCTMTYVI